MTMNQERVARHDDNLKARGGRVLRTIRLTPEAADALAKIESIGKSATKTINELLISEGVKVDYQG